MIKTEPAFKMSVTGIDGSGKDTVTRKALERVSSESSLSIVKLGRPAYRIENGEAIQIFQRTTEGIDRLHAYCDEIGKPALITAANALNVVVQTRILERQVNTDGYDIIASSRDPRVDPTVYFDFYGGSTASRVDLERRGRFMQSLTGVARNLIVLLEVDPETAVERIEARIAAENAGAESMRPKWRHIHENVEDLSSLASGYHRALDELSCVEGTDIVRVNTNGKPAEEVTDEVTQAILESYTKYKAA